jgi:hypothetical protein
MSTLPDDKLDQAFSAFFQAELTRRPWPPAPRPATPRGPAATDHSRLVLAASVAVLLGGCWALSNGFDVSDRGPASAVPGATNLLPGSTAAEKGVLPALRKEKAKDDPMGGPINLP